MSIYNKVTLRDVVKLSILWQYKPFSVDGITPKLRHLTRNKKFIEKILIELYDEGRLDFLQVDGNWLFIVAR